MGSSLFWFDNWTGLGPLYFLTPADFYCNEEINNVSDVVTKGRGHEPTIRNNLPEDLANYRLIDVQPPYRGDELDKPWWMLETKGDFTASLHGSISEAKEKKGMFTRRYGVWHFKVPLGDVLRSWGYHMPSMCSCCASPKEETVHHIFLRCETAQRTWSYFSAAGGINIAGMHLHQLIVKWWTTDVLPRMKPIFYAIPSIIVWELWKKRNGDKHKDKVSISRVIFQASRNIQQLVKVRKPGIRSVPHR
ncbi:uncharacterized protein LOC132062339 [Lycium ferocissimum]|uniref:uncharacterized protein LOC132062339 n=1 Tax=Lycium ferocissimum TaxID=112874 RepID=UPI00281511C0|nr:uncharacterized protein LOC132062339 [Lycium ferocissimum]